MLPDRNLRKDNTSATHQQFVLKIASMWLINSHVIKSAVLTADIPHVNPNTSVLFRRSKETPKIHRGVGF